MAVGDLSNWLHVFGNFRCVHEDAPPSYCQRFVFGVYCEEKGDFELKRRYALTAMGLLALSLSGCSALPIASASKPNIRQIFLNYVPPNEPGAPHDMEWIVEHYAGDGGYYGTKYFPGDLQITEHTHADIEHYSTSNPKKITSITYTLNNVAWYVIWKINGEKLDFFFYQKRSSKQWAELPNNTVADLAMFGYGNPNG